MKLLEATIDRLEKTNELILNAPQDSGYFIITPHFLVTNESNKDLEALIWNEIRLVSKRPKEQIEWTTYDDSRGHIMEWRIAREFRTQL